MIYIKSPSTDPHFNLALEQYVFDEMDRWTNDFLTQMPEDKRKHYQKIIKEREYL